LEDTSHHSKIKKTNVGIREYDKVSRMWIGMKKTILKNLLEVSPGKSIRNNCPVNPFFFKYFDIADFGSVNQFHGQHPGSCIFCINFRSRGILILCVLYQMVLKSLNIDGFVSEIHLFENA